MYQVIVEKIKTKPLTEITDFFKTIISPTVTEENVADMLAQYIMTKPALDLLFNKRSDVVTQKIEEFINDIYIDGLDKHYDDIKKQVEKVKNEVDEQDFLRGFYDKVIRTTLKDVADQLGVVYTPVEIVDFMIRITDDIIKKEFGVKKWLNSDNISIYEPFAWTWIFLTRLAQYLSKEALAKDNKLYWSEILLLPYYIAKINIEKAIWREFKNMFLTDVFYNLWQVYDAQTPIQVIISNPPYFARAESGNSKTIRGDYKILKKRIQETFAKETESRNISSLYDSYIMAMRMALDKVKNGVISFVINNGWLYSNSGQGVRKALQRELYKIYVIDLKGNIRNNDPSEGENVFGVKVGISIVFMIKKN